MWSKRWAVHLAVGALISVLAIQAQAQVRVSEVVVVNAASFERALPVSPGCWATAFGDFQSVGVLPTAAQQTPFPTTLGGVEVRVNGIAAPLSYVGGQQINFLVPKATPVGRVSLEIRVGGNPVYQGNLQVFPVSPALVSIDPGSPAKPGAILNQDGSLNSSQRPARRGEVIQIFGIGAAFAELPEVDGAPAPDDRLIPTTYAPTVYISVAEAPVLFSGLAPRLVNVWQINVQVPDLPYIRGLTPVAVRIGGLMSNVVSIWVAE